MPKILLADDNVEIAELLCRNLQRNGYTVVTGDNGARAYELAVSEQPDLILMDLNMPVVDGWEATRKIKLEDSVAKTPIIALSAYSSDEDKQRAIEHGCIAYISKPVDITLLLHAIELALKNRYDEGVASIQN